MTEDEQVDNNSRKPSRKLPSPEGRGAGGEANLQTIRRTIVGVASKEKVAFAREQRKAPTTNESILWSHLRRRKLGHRIRRQHPLGEFILDFYCAEAKLAIEIDGPLHIRQPEYDTWRDAQLQRLGIEVLRFPDLQVTNDLEGVLEAIRSALRERRPHP